MSDPPAPSDYELIVHIREGNRDAFRELYDRHIQRVYVIALSICRCEEDAQTICVTVFWELWRKPDHYHPDRGSLRTYLTVLANSRAKDLVRRASSHKKMLQSPEFVASEKRRRESDDDPQENLVFEEQMDLVRQCVSLMTKEYRVMLEMAFFESKTHREIAEATGIPLGTVKSRIRRGLARFAEIWKGESFTSGTAEEGEASATHAKDAR